MNGLPCRDLSHSFTSVGKSPVQKEFSISANRRNVDLGKILIAEATEMLKGVEVVAQKPLVKVEIDKVTYSIEDDPDSKPIRLLKCSVKFRW